MTTIETSGVASTAPGHAYTVALPAGLPLLNANRSRRQHWAVVRRAARDIRLAAFAAARNQRIPLLDRAHILYVIHPTPQTRKRDPANWAESAKAAVDGIVDAGVFVDDDSKHVIGPDPRLGEPVKGGQLVLHIIPLDDSQVIEVPCRKAYPGQHPDTLDTPGAAIRVRRIGGGL